MSGRKLGVLGGTFDPVHLGHLIIAEEAADRLGLDVVVFVPARDPWRKERSDIASAADRMAMVRLATRDNPRFRVSEVDLKREGPSYSVDTLDDLREQEDDAQLYFLVGYDTLMDIPHWREPKRLMNLAHLVTVVRPGYAIDFEVLERVMPGVRHNVTLLEIPEVGISSTEVRRRIAAGKSVRYWVPEPVAEYIRQRGLYGARDTSSGVASP